MKVLVFGGAGMLGTDVVDTLRSRGHEVLAPTIYEADITDPTVVAEWSLRGFGWIVNCAAYTAVDKAEIESDDALKVNAIAPGFMAKAAALAGARLLQVSTDFVFDGEAAEPYTEDAPTNPLGQYGRSKLLGEEAVKASGGEWLIVRTAWLFGPNGASFPRTMWRAAKAGRELRVVADQVGSPTYTADLARVFVDLIEVNAFPGVYHAAGPDSMTWHEFAERTLRAAGISASIEPIATDDWPTPTRRPKYSVLSTEKLEKLGIRPMRCIDEALAEFVGRLGEP